MWLRVELSDNRAAHGHGGMDVHGHRQHTGLHIWARPPVNIHVVGQVMGSGAVWEV